MDDNEYYRMGLKLGNIQALSKIGYDSINAIAEFSNVADNVKLELNMVAEYLDRIVTQIDESL